MDAWLTYAPYIWFDLKEPFYPERVGVTVITEPGDSPSFRRSFHFAQQGLDKIIEYAIWWDYEIGHLYELEHVWVYVGSNGEVLDCEASFHGRVLKGLRKDRSNLLDGTHVQLYSQPGKHAFSPLPELFELLPDAEAAASTLAGNDGLLINELFKDKLSKSEQIDEWVRRYLQTYAFNPAFSYKQHQLSPQLFTSWDTLKEEIPLRIAARVKQLAELYGALPG